MHVIKEKTKSKAFSTSSTTIEKLCNQQQIMQLFNNNIMRIPFLIKGQLRIPKMLDIHQIERSFEILDNKRGPSESWPTYVCIDEVQVLRESVYDRDTLTRTSSCRYSLMPMFKPEEVIESDMTLLADELFNLPVEEIFRYVESLRNALEASDTFVDYLRESTLATSEHPDAWHNSGFSAIYSLLEPDDLRQMIDQDICAWGIPGTKLLDGWQTIGDAQLIPAPVNMLADAIFADEHHQFTPRIPQLRAMPTRQLHITAGNAPQIPFISAMRAIATKSAAVIKSPYGATMPGALLALAAVVGNPHHPITKHLSIVYWPGGGAGFETAFYAPTAFERIVVWGAPEAVMSVKQKALHCKVLTFNPRYGMSLLGREIFQAADLNRIAIKALTDALIANQKACIATQVIYVEGEIAQIKKLAVTLQTVLAKFDKEVPNLLLPRHIGEIKRLQKGKLLNAEWYVNELKSNETNGRFSSGVVISEETFNINIHPMCRLIVLRPVAELSDAFSYMHPGVSTVSIYPETRCVQLRDRIAAHGVSNILPLGQSGSGFPGQSHDGMLVLSELVDWKNG